MSRPIDPRLPRALPVVRRLLVTLAGLHLTGALLTVAQAALLAQVIVGLVDAPHRAPAHALVLLLFAVAGRALVAAAQEWAGARASARARADLRVKVLRAVVRLGPAWSDRQPAGRLVTAAGPGLEAMDGYLTRAVPALTAAAVVPVVVLARIGVADWQSAALLLVTLPLVPLFMVLVGVTTRRRTQAEYTSLARLSGHFLDLLQGLTTLKVYGQAHRQVEAVRAATDAYRVSAMQTLRTAFLSGLVLDLLATLSVAVVAVDVGLRLDSGDLALGPALLVLLLAPELFAPLRAVGAQHHAAEQGRAALCAALDVLDEAAPLPERPTAPVPCTPFPLRLRGLRVVHPGRSQPALVGLDLDLLPGEVVAVQGTSGSGKSTLLAVLLRLVAPTGGVVALADGTDVLQLDPADWRAGTAWAPQRPHPTQATVGAEVLLGARGASPDQVLAALADCHGLHPDTALGEDGTRISTGQRRRIALARALLRARAVRDGGGVPLVLLDEPSEDLDADTEQVVAAVVSGLAGWATVVVVTHSARLATVADRRLELADGRLVSDERQDRRVVVVPPAPPLAPEPVPFVTAPPRPGLQVLLRVLLADQARSTARRLLLAGALSGAVGLSGLALLSTSVWLILRAAQHPEVQALALAVVGVRGFALSRALLRYAERLVSHDGALRLLAGVRSRVFAALEPLAPAGLAELRRGDLLRRFVSDVDAVQEALVRAVVPLVGAAITAVGAVALAAVLVPVAGLVLAAGLLIGLVVAPALGRQLAGDGAGRATAAGHQESRTGALIDGLAELTAYGADTRALTELERAGRALVQVARRPGRAAAAASATVGLAFAGTLVLVLATSADAVTTGVRSPLSLGVLAACVLAGFDALSPLPAAFAAWAGFRAGLGRVFALLTAAPPVPEPGLPARAPTGPLTVCLAGVTVGPAVGAPDVLRGAVLTVRSGDRVALMGPSGCGKSTLLTAALRLLPLRAGSIELVSGGIQTPLADLASTDVPPLAAGSLQGDHVFHASLRDNLRLVRPAARDSELDAVAVRAGLSELLQTLPEGWSTSAGPDGAALSGGQRQRLLLARALLADPEVLVLDEPTAHLDETTERAVLLDLLAATRGRTVLLSTHRRLPDDELDQIVLVRDAALHAGRQLVDDGVVAAPDGLPEAAAV